MHPDPTGPDATCDQTKPDRTQRAFGLDPTRPDLTRCAPRLDRTGLDTRCVRTGPDRIGPHVRPDRPGPGATCAQTIPDQTGPNVRPDLNLQDAIGTAVRLDPTKPDWSRRAPRSDGTRLDPMCAPTALD